jgi:hypothetical protein
MAKSKKDILIHILVTFIILCDIFSARYFLVKGNFLGVVAMLSLPISIVVTRQLDYHN